MTAFVLGSVLVLAGVSLASGAHDARSTWRVPGCYEVQAGPLTMPVGQSAEAPAWPLPARIRLSSEAPSAEDREAHYVREGLAVRPHRLSQVERPFDLGAWTNDDGNLEIRWNGGFSAVMIRATRRGAEWIGTVTFRSDDGSPMPSAPVTLQPYPCE